MTDLGARRLSGLRPLPIRALGSDRPAPTLPPVLVAIPLLLAAAAMGRFLAGGRVGLSMGILIGIPFFVLVFFDLALAIAGWVALLFFSHLPALSVGPTAVELLLLLAWLGVAGTRAGRLPVLRTSGAMIPAILALLLWMLVSASWATSPRAALSGVGNWSETAVMFLVVAMTLTRTRDVRIVALAFVVGACISVAMGLLGYGGPTDAVRRAAVGDRLTGGGGDPNYQAAAYLAAMFMAGGLVAFASSRAAKLRLVFALGFITIGFVATESRGGLIALVVGVIAALVLLREQRRQVLGAIAVGALGIAVWSTVHAGLLKRITDLGGGTSGRHDQWTVAWRIFKLHPLLGVGLGNFELLEPRYVLLPGTLTNVHLVAETPELVHNSYLQLMTETGLIGLGLFLLVVWLSLRCTWRAIRRFEQVGQPELASVGRAVLIGTIAMLAANFFISNVNDFRLWVLFALGPVMLAVADQAPVRAAAGSPGLGAGPGP